MERFHRERERERARARALFTATVEKLYYKESSFGPDLSTESPLGIGVLLRDVLFIALAVTVVVVLLRFVVNTAFWRTSAG